MGLTLVTPPTVWPVTLAEAKAQVRVKLEDNSEDALIGSLIRAATAHIEKALDISLTPRTWVLTLDEFSDAIELPRGPVTSVTSVEYSDGDGVTQTLAAENYTVDLVSRSAWIVRNSDATWPTIIDGINAIAITYEAGYDAIPSNLEDLKHAILLLIGAWFMQREAISEKAIQQVPLAVEALIYPYRALVF